MPEITPVDIPLGGTPRWVVAAPDGVGEGVFWAVTMSDGSVQTYRVAGGSATVVNLGANIYPVETPPVLVVGADGPALLTPDGPAATATHPIFFNGQNGLAYVDPDGALVVRQGETEIRLVVDALPDARILVDEHDRLLLLSGPTTRYGHGVLGDTIEASSITLVETAPDPRVAQVIEIPPPRVVEGIAPLWVDWDEDGTREIIVTLSDADNGAQIVVYDENGDKVAAGPAIGQGYRWRHQLSVAPFGPEGQLELVDVLTPHIGGVVEFYRWNGDALEIVARLPGYTSHVMGTRNLDMAVAADVDGDGRTELIVPDQQRHGLHALAHTADGVAVLWSAPADGKIITNVAAATHADGGLAVGVGKQEGVLRVWQASRAR